MRNGGFLKDLIEEEKSWIKERNCSHCWEDPL